MTDIKLPTKTLVDRRNYDSLKERILSELSGCTLMGFDLETEDTNAHNGIKQLRKEDDEGNKTGNKVVFDWNRMTVTGMSMAPDNTSEVYYFNLAHADIENRLTWEEVKIFLDAVNESCSLICHKAPFEITVMANSLGYKLKNVICTLQMAVSAYGPDEYDISQYPYTNLGDIPTLFSQARELFGTQLNSDDDSDEDIEETKSNRLNPKQQELLGKVIGKESKASYSYNGLNKSLAYGYDLKSAVKSWFGYQMTTYEECLNGKRNMGELTGDEVVSYGADDAFWALELFYKLYAFMETRNPESVKVFFEQENPMIYVFSDVCRSGMKVNHQAIEARRAVERKAFADCVRKMKACVKALLPFPIEPDERLMKYEKWYYGLKKDGSKGPKDYEFYRQRLIEWAESPDSPDDFVQSCQVSSPVSNQWAGGKNSGLSIGHYFQSRLMMYDLCQVPAIVYKGKISSDSDCRGEVRDKIANKIVEEPDKADFYKAADELIKTMGELTSIEQRMKLYITPYLCLTDPDTGRMYPELTSMLATRRMACSNPNAMQLAKRGESTYVRGFYLPDSKDEVLVSLDWSQIELVLIGEFSGDPEFKKAYGQLPYSDLHLGAAADVLSVVIPEVTEEMMNNMHNMTEAELPPKLLIKPNGESLSPAKAKKFWRTEVGKGSNFNYWYSGALSSVGEKMGWSPNQMWEATERYRERFPVAEAWRVNLIEDARMTGFVQLPDGHRRYRYEATYEWQNITRRMFQAYQDEGVTAFGNETIRAIKSRSGNQLVNALIQGSCATLAKRSILSINQKLKETDIRARFKMPVHDELLYSVHKDDVVKFIKLAKSVMCDHPDIIKTLKIDATASVGLTFEPFSEDSAPIGQIEVDEAPACLGFGDGVKLTDEQIEETVKYLFDHAEVA